MTTPDRKLEHIKICLEEKVESEYSGFEDVMLIHNALPELNLDEIDTNTRFLGKELSAPFMIASMTGGHRDTKSINKNIAIAVEELKLGMGVGSQRAAIEKPELADSFTVVRDYAPNALIYANIGVAQLLEDIEIADRAVEMIDADALAIHLNFLQEAIQPEGDTNAKGCLKVIEEVCSSVKVPVIIKETGAGISGDVARVVKKAGASAIDVGGRGGTSWSGVEVYRADGIWKDIGRDFWNWGIPTAFCIVECCEILPTIATGGIRSGIDVAKAIALGARVASSALPFLRPATISAEEVVKKLEYFLQGLKVAMFLTSSEKVEDLMGKVFITGKLKEWLKFRDLRLRGFTHG